MRQAVYAPATPVASCAARQMTARESPYGFKPIIKMYRKTGRANEGCDIAHPRVVGEFYATKLN